MINFLRLLSNPIKSAGLSKKYFRNMGVSGFRAGWNLIHRMEQDLWFQENLSMTEVNLAFYVLLVGVLLSILFCWQFRNVLETMLK